MIEAILAQGTNPAVWWGGGVVTVAIGGLLVKHVSKRSIHLNGRKFTDQELCDDRHERIETDRKEGREWMKEISTKLDTITASLNKRGD